MLFRPTNRAHTLLEVVILVALLGILAAIAMPRLSRGTKGACGSALGGDLRVLRGAIDRYNVEHGGSYPSVANFADQLTLYTDYGGDFQATQDQTHRYGPYLRRVPPLPVGLEKGSAVVVKKAEAGAGWVYDEDTGEIHANCGPAEADDTGQLYWKY
jgi:type II secretory pathway pseudopilin PulG